MMADMAPLPGALACALEEDGFFVIDNFVPRSWVEALARAYDAVVEEAVAPDKAVGRSTTRVHDFVTRGAQFDGLYTDPLVLAAADATIGGPFFLSTLLGRSVHAGAGAQEPHVDAARDDTGWPMLGFIVMVDPFTAENGATRLVPGSHHRRDVDRAARPLDMDFVPVTGPAGACLVYNGSLIHGHGANATGQWRRSIQGAYVRRGLPRGFDFRARIGPDIPGRLGAVARSLLDV